MKARSILSWVLACGLAVTLTACGGLSEGEVSAYVQGELDCTYKGQYSQEYLDLVEGMTESYAQQQYEDNAQTEAQRLLSYLDVHSPTDQVNERAVQLVKDIYASARYTVGEGTKLQGGDFAVEVTLSPIELFHLIPEETYRQVWTEICQEHGTTPDLAIASLSDAEYQALDEEYANQMLDGVEAVLPQLTYGQEQSVTLRLQREGESYILASDDWTALDDMVIDYTGSYR